MNHDWLWSWWHLDHPTLVERIRAIDALVKKGEDESVLKRDEWVLVEKEVEMVKMEVDKEEKKEK